jgi:hypothetical protein
MCYAADAGLNPFILIFIVVDVCLVLLGLMTAAVVLAGWKWKHGKLGSRK